MTHSGEIPDSENTPLPPSLEIQREVLETIQLSHYLRLREAGTIARALSALGEDSVGEQERAKLGNEPMANVFATYRPNDRTWITGLEFPHYELTPNGDAWRRRIGCTVPVGQEVDGAEPAPSSNWDDYFTTEGARLLATLRQELIDARDSGILPNLYDTLSAIY